MATAILKETIRKRRCRSVELRAEESRPTSPSPAAVLPFLLGSGRPGDFDGFVRSRGPNEELSSGAVAAPQIERYISADQRIMDEIEASGRGEALIQTPSRTHDLRRNTGEPTFITAADTEYGRMKRLPGRWSIGVDLLSSARPQSDVQYVPLIT
jgi:hypothetical protein